MLAGAARVIGTLAAAGLFGGMVFFAAVLAPLVFSQLDDGTAGRFIRAAFPRYYLFLLVAASVAAAGFSAVDRWASLAMVAVAGVTVWLWQDLMPRINHLRDASLAGNAEAGRRFARAHQASVWVNAAQLLVATGVLVRVLT